MPVEEFEEGKRLSLEDAQREAAVVEALAKEKAATEKSGEGPENRHYEEASKMLDSAPDSRERRNVIDTMVLRLELQKLMGEELYKIYKEVEGEIMNQASFHADQKVTPLFKEKEKLDPDAFLERLTQIETDMLKEVEEKIRNDSRIQKAFEGRGETLERAIHFLKEYIPRFFVYLVGRGR